MVAAQPFWVSKSLREMSKNEWESLCDGCGKCCLHKLECEDSGDVFYTSVACKYLNLDSCSCSDYTHRKSLVAECLELRVDDIDDFFWLPQTCAYRLLAEGKPLFDWHPLVSGSKDTIHSSGVSVKGKVLSEENVNEDDMEEYVIRWVT